MVKITSKFDGRQLESLLIGLGPRVAGRVSGNAVRAAGRVVAAEQRKEVPVDTGDLRKSIKVRSAKSRLRTRKSAVAGVFGTEGPLAHIIEFGVAPHTIAAKGKGLSDGTSFYGLTVNHPGTSPDPFITRAFEASKFRAVDKIKESLAAGIARESAKLARGRRL